MKIVPDVFEAVTGPHHEAVLYARGEATDKAIIILHGRGGSALDSESLYEALGTPVYALFPEAVGNTWYPERFLEPQTKNQPGLDSAVAVVETTFQYLESLGISKERVVLAGFSQGACLAAEYLKRYPALYGGAALMSGGLIGTDDEAELPIVGSLFGTPVYLGCDAEDPHIPLSRVEITARSLSSAGARVQLEVFRGYGHRPHQTALQFLQTLVSE